MISGQNVGTITGRLTRDPEVVNDKVIDMQIAVDYAGRDTDNKDSNTGFFNVVYFTSTSERTTKFLKSQMENGNISKGSALTILYSLSQDRWSQGEQRREKTKLIAEAIDYAGPGNNKNNDEGSSEGGSTPAMSSPKPQESYAPPEF